MFGMKKLKRILALVCALNMLFGNLSLDSFVAVASEIPAAEEQVSYEGDSSAQTQDNTVADVAPAPAPRVEEIKIEAPKQDAPQAAEQKVDATKQDAPQSSEQNAEAPKQEAAEQKQEAPKVEVIANPVDDIAACPTEIISVGEVKAMALNTILTLEVSEAQAIVVLVDAPVKMKVVRGDDKNDYPSTNGKSLEALFNVAPGEYELTFSSGDDLGSITVEVVDVQTYLKNQGKSAGKSESKAEKAEEEQQASDAQADKQEPAAADQASAADDTKTDAAQDQADASVVDMQDAAPAAGEQSSDAAQDAQPEIGRAHV